MGPSKTTSLSEVLFSGVQRRLLALLFGQPDRSFYLNELARLAAAGKGAVHRELARMESSGIIRMTPIGRQRHYQANRGCPIFEELRGITIKTFGMTDVIREALSPLQARIDCAFVYGSVAKGTDSASSDIDLMVVGDELGYVQLHEALDHAQKTLGRPINPTLYKRADFERKHAEGHHFVTRVLSQPILPLIGDLHAIATPPSREPGEDRQAEG